MKKLETIIHTETVNYNDNIDELAEVHVATEEIFNGKILHVIRDDVRIPNGEMASREVIRHIGAVCIIPLTDENEVIVERQFRYPVNEIITEIPAGKLDYKDEDRLEAAKRELREETGYTATEWIDLGIFYPAAAYSDEKITLYLARGLSKGERELDADEFIDVYKVPMEALIKDVMDGKITDNKTQMAVLKAAEYLRRK